MASNFLEIGKIVGIHGIQGEIKLENWTDSPEWLKRIKNLYFDNGEKNAGLTSSRVHKNHLLIKLDGIDTPEKAQALRGEILYMDKSDVRLPKNRFFISDLIGLEVFDGNTNEFYGKITDVFATGANNVYQIEREGEQFLFPAVDHMIKNTDIEKGVIEVLPISGIFDGESVSDAN